MAPTLKPRVLIVEDDPDLLVVLRVNLTAIGVEPILAGDGRTAISADPGRASRRGGARRDASRDRRVVGAGGSPRAGRPGPRRGVLGEEGRRGHGARAAARGLGLRGQAVRHRPPDRRRVGGDRPQPQDADRAGAATSPSNALSSPECLRSPLRILGSWPRLPTVCSARSVENPSTGHRSGSCGRRADTFPNTASSVATATSSRRSAIPTRRSRSRSSRSGGCRWTPRSCSATSWCRSSRPGSPFRIEAGRGPVLDEPIRSPRDLDRLRPLEPEVDEPYTLEAIRALVSELEVPLIGFAGAPFTLASYLIEGGPSRDHAKTKGLMFARACDVGCLDGRARRRWSCRICERRWRRARAPCRSSTRGSGRSRPPLIVPTCCRTCGGCSMGSPTSPCRRSTSASGRPSCSS